MPAAAVPRMRGAPGLHAFDVHGVAEVLAVLGPRQPGSLTGDLARVPTGAGRAVPLPREVAMVRLEKPPATQALALSGLRHRCSPPGSSKTAPSAMRTPARTV